MHRLSGSKLLDVWERGQHETIVQRMLVLLAAACPEMQIEALAELSLGRRDALLLTLHEWTFGSQIVGLAVCPRCGEQLEFDCQVAQLRIEAETEPATALALSTNNYEVQFRLPNSLDLNAAALSRDAASAQRFLFEQCLLSARHHGEEVSTEQLPVEVTEAVAARMAEADPQADVQVRLTCPRCNHQWQSPFDITSFFWSEVSARAARLLREVHALARAYGWREADILALSPWRRQMYLELAAE